MCILKVLLEEKCREEPAYLEVPAQKANHEESRFCADNDSQKQICR